MSYENINKSSLLISSKQQFDVSIYRSVKIHFRFGILPEICDSKDEVNIKYLTFNKLQKI
jgi:hypothetical protein